MASKLKPANILLERHLKELSIKFVREHKFCPDRKWRADYWLEELMVAGHFILVEIHGSVWQQGRHTRGKGFEADRIKMNTAQMLGYIVLEFSTGQVLRGEAKAFLQQWLGQ